MVRPNEVIYIAADSRFFFPFATCPLVQVCYDCYCVDLGVGGLLKQDFTCPEGATKPALGKEVIRFAMLHMAISQAAGAMCDAEGNINRVVD